MATHDRIPGTCGAFGGVGRNGEPCGAVAGWGTEHRGTGPCRNHEPADPTTAVEPADGDGVVLGEGFTDVHHPLKRAFLQAYAINGTIAAACRAAGIDRGSYYNWTRTDKPYYDPVFVAAVEVAREAALDRIEHEARRRAIEGVREPILHQGAVVKDEDGQTLYRVRYSDTLAIALLAHGGRVSSIHQLRHSGPHGEPLTLNPLQIRITLPDGEERAASSNGRPARLPAGD